MEGLHAADAPLGRACARIRRMKHSAARYACWPKYMLNIQTYARDEVDPSYLQAKRIALFYMQRYPAIDLNFPAAVLPIQNKTIRMDSSPI